ncbi:hypothetical protein HX069_06525 [Myroides odoratimimus]|uniref:hypothetical protein n=1 Tax=Myroides odoratimimus TaxID=76832 RepID=UPI0025751780|nr:hypothetical protein [Myroides odoratimimus]MDM1526695.1 hypothetical protein [Myroides odoratimimus]MDM1678809.1 hypothetical protein [Myroides odoratimimus]MEC4034158.1 hypothetical protein [Myroides odoratimimus]
MQQKLLLLFISITLCFNFISCSSDDVQISHQGKNKALLIGKWKLESKKYYDRWGGAIAGEVDSTCCPPQTLEFHRHEIMIQTDFYKESEDTDIICDERSPFQWFMIEDKLYLGVGKEVNTDDYQDYDIRVLPDEILVLERSINEYDKEPFYSNAKFVRITYNKIHSY